MKFFASIGFLLLLQISSGCSDSTPPSQNYPLQLELDSANKVGAVYTVLSLRVTKSGVPVPGASLMETENPSFATYKVTGNSDSTGRFPEFAVNWDTVNEISLQAVKDSLKSNNILYP